MIWTIDTWVLVTANKKNDISFSCRHFLDLVRKKHRLAMNSEVIGEFQNALKNKSSFSAMWFSKISKKLDWLDSPIENEQDLKSKLIHDLPEGVPGFDRDDVKFVVLCYMTQDRHLISGDIGPGDYSEPLTKWLREGYDICFHDLDDKEPYHKPRHECTRPETS